jgi:hypothetical protein
MFGLSWAPLIAGLTPHGVRHYTHIDDEMITEMLASLTRRLQSAVEARARILPVLALWRFIA